MTTQPPAYVCPRCDTASWNPGDATYNYCARCHAYTGPRDIPPFIVTELAADVVGDLGGDSEICVELAGVIHRSALQRDRNACQDRQMRDAVSAVLVRLDPPPDVAYILFCRVCDPALANPALHPNSADRGRWAAAHTRATGHNSWLVRDLTVPLQTSDAHNLLSYCADGYGDSGRRLLLHRACPATCPTCDAPCECSCHRR